MSSLSPFSQRPALYRPLIFSSSSRKHPAITIASPRSPPVLPSTTTARFHCDRLPPHLDHLSALSTRSPSNLDHLRAFSLRSIATSPRSPQHTLITIAFSPRSPQSVLIAIDCHLTSITSARSHYDCFLTSIISECSHRDRHLASITSARSHYDWHSLERAADFRLLQLESTESPISRPYLLLPYLSHFLSLKLSDTHH